MSSVSIRDAYALGGAEPRGVSTRYSIPLDGTPTSLGPFPFTPRSLSIVNQTGATITVTDDRGEQYVAATSTEVTYGVGPTLRLTAQLSQLVTSGKATVVVYDSPQPVSSSQLASLAPAGSNVQRVSGLPSSPFDGQVISLAVDPVNFPGVEWLLIYNVATGYWDCVGGTPISCSRSVGALVSGFPAVGGGWFYDNNVGSKLSTPFAGDYMISASAWLARAAADTQASLAVSNVTTGVTPLGTLRVDTDLIGASNMLHQCLALTDELASTILAGAVIAPSYSGSSLAFQLQSHRLAMMPKRIH